MKIRYTTTLQLQTVDKVRDIVKTKNLKGSNVVFEQALSDYFSKPIILEKQIDDDTIHRVIIQGHTNTFEVVKVNINLDDNFNLYTALANGFTQVN